MEGHDAQAGREHWPVVFMLWPRALPARPAGHRVIELERYATSTKIWSTKIKRLRIADLLCVRCGMRFEVRSKSDLEVKMSDSPETPDRRWDAGLRDQDVCAFIAVREEEGRMQAAGSACYFTVEEMRRAIGSSKLGPPKSASEGSERDRTWPTWTPGRAGTVMAIEDGRLRVSWDDGAGYSYPLGSKIVYCRPGDHFAAGVRMLAGVMAAHHEPRCAPARPWDPIADLEQVEPTARYAAVKALAYLREGDPDVDERLFGMTQGGGDGRIALEAAATLARRGDVRGQALLRSKFNEEKVPSPLGMEVVLILSEISDDWAAADLEDIAQHRDTEPEVISACLWGLAFGRRPRPASLVEFLSHPEEDVAVHAIAALSRCLTRDEVPVLVEALGGEERRAAAAAEVLARCPGITTAALLWAGFSGKAAAPVREWALFILGRQPEALVRTQAGEAGIAEAALASLTPLWRGLQRSWIVAGRVQERLAFVVRQALP